ncbi:MAG: hypothetical protein HXY30_00155 [Pseudorhodoplanes sp.]|nr:hypothetical protein [Pseudorhodoplanes sp.]
MLANLQLEALLDHVLRPARRRAGNPVRDGARCGRAGLPVGPGLQLEALLLDAPLLVTVADPEFT